MTIRLILLCALCAAAAVAQRPMPTPISDDTTGFTQIFDGKTLEGWDGDPALWSVRDGVIVGETKADNPLQRNSFLIWRGGAPGDFELKLEYRITNTNSGIQYRSVELPDVGQWVLKGYQADIDAANTYTGQVYEERGRGFLAMRGQVTHVADGKVPSVQGSLGNSDELKALIKEGWNSFHLVARGATLTEVVNGRTMSVVIDDDTVNRSLGGLLGIQLHVGEPMTIEVRNVWLKPL